MTFNAFSIFVLIFEFIFYGFHLSILILLFGERKKFDGPFYNMFRINFVSDLVYIFMQLQYRLPNFGLWADFYKTHGYLATIIFNTAGSIVYLQFLIHALIAFNRFTLFCLPLKHKGIWSKQWYTVAIILTPIIMNGYFLFEEGEFLYNKTDEVIVKYKNNGAMTTTFIVSLPYMITITFIEAICNLCAVINYHKMNNMNAITKNDTNLLYISCIIFAIQAIRCLYNVARPLLSQNITITYILQFIIPFIADIYAWTGSFSLIILSFGRKYESVPTVRNIAESNEPIPKKEDEIKSGTLLDSMENAL